MHDYLSVTCIFVPHGGNSSKESLKHIPDYIPYLYQRYGCYYITFVDISSDVQVVALLSFVSLITVLGTGLAPTIKYAA